MALKSLKPKRKGDTWNGLQIRIDNPMYDLEGCTARMHFRKSRPEGSLAFSYSTEEGTLVRNGNVFQMSPKKLDYSAGEYYFDIEITFSNGEVRTYYEHKIQILQDVSY